MKGLPKLLQLVADNKNRGQYKIEAKDDTATVYVYDVIGAWYGGVDEAQFAKDIAALEVKNIALRINSPGGDVFAARTMMTALAAHPAKVTAYIDGLAASAATSLMLAADSVVMTRGARLMVHEAWTVALGNKGEFTAQAAILAGIDDEIANDYANRTGKPAADFAALMQAETWFNADQAKEIGFVDEIVETTKPAANLWNLSAYKNAPKEENNAATEVAAEVAAHRASLERRLGFYERIA